jgi:hypothetical protein
MSPSFLLRFLPTSWLFCFQPLPGRLILSASSPAGYSFPEAGATLFMLVFLLYHAVLKNSTGFWKSQLENGII